MNLLNSFNNTSEIFSPESITNQIPLISINSNLTSDNLIQLLSNNPFLVNALDEKGETFLSYAIKRNNKKIINLILSSPLLNLNYVDKNDNTYLHLAVIQQNLEAIRLLIKKGISVNSQNKDGNTPLHLAYYLNFGDIINCLLAFNADRNIKNNKGLIPEEITPTNDISKIVGFDVSMNLEVNYDDELKFDKKYKTMEVNHSNKRITQRKNSNKNNNNILFENKIIKKKFSKNFNNNSKRNIKTKIDDRKRSSLFYNPGKDNRKISNIAWNFNENDKFIRKESVAYPFYLDFISQNKEKEKEKLNTIKSNDTRINTCETFSDNNRIIFNNTKKSDKRVSKVINNKVEKNFNNITNKLLMDFLLQINLQEYYDLMNNNGFSDILKIIEDTKKGDYIKDTQLNQIGINKPGDRAKILIRLEEKANLYDFDIPKAVYYFNLEYINNNDLNQIPKDKNLFKFFLWLKDINLEIYFFNFVNNGYFSIDLLLMQMISKNPLTDEILKNEILIEKLGYRTRIMNKLEEEYPSFLEKLKNVNTIDIKKENSRICRSCTIF